MKKYKYGDWDFEWEEGKEGWGGFDERIYIDLNGSLITGILEGFYSYTANTAEEKNCQYVENGRRKFI